MAELPDADHFVDRAPCSFRRLRGTLARIALAIVGTSVVCALFAVLEGTTAGYADESAAVVDVSGSYDIEIEAVGAATGTVQRSEGGPAAFLLATPAGAQFTKTEPVTWTVAVLNRAAPGVVVVHLSDPVDVPFTLGGTQYPDLYSTLRFTVRDGVTGEALVSDVAGADLGPGTAGLSIGQLDTGARRDLTVSVLLDPGTGSVYDGHTTTFQLVFAGTTA